MLASGNGGADRQHRFGSRASGHAPAKPLRRRQGRHHPSHPLDGARARPQRILDTTQSRRVRSRPSSPPSFFYGDDGKFAGRTAEFMAHVPLGRPGASRRRSPSGALPGLARRQPHQRPGAGRRWRLDRGIHDVSADMQIELAGAGVALEGDRNPIAEAALAAPAGQWRSSAWRPGNRRCPARVAPPAAGSCEHGPRGRLLTGTEKLAVGDGCAGPWTHPLPASLAIAGMPMRRHPDFSAENAGLVGGTRADFRLPARRVLINAVGFGLIGEGDDPLGDAATAQPRPARPARHSRRGGSRRALPPPSAIPRTATRPASCSPSTAVGPPVTAATSGAGSPTYGRRRVPPPV